MLQQLKHLETKRKGAIMKLATIFEANEIELLQPGVVVESWRRVVTTFSGKRKLKEEFGDDWPDKVTRVYKLYCWWVGKGMPMEHRCSIESYQFMQRVSHFFGTYK
jgi:hypothetical protein